ncbi:CRISPR-associated protein Cas4 [Fluoribacter gormanii]|uniref:CRISPR-associated protein Cas4 n=1 Tax=Fluoribacter gormanii TaxID=464 RepID=UPI001A2A606F|nr:CRISPR-associated protein Cas4 [Fluoribacter gormanii]MCW8469386.1 CRISPR-associated protein Cas4 [Fluoribacter gormanii]HAT9524530.1 CRISPR-associated protein Cas4 [Legionella pneumophila subsp. pneumophila]
MIDRRYIPLSALQHYAFCPRQCAFIHIEQSWADNWLTAQGNLLHERVDSAEPETRKGIRYERGVSVCAEHLGLIGKLDLVEVDIASGEYKPIEYKRGKPKVDNWDRIQLCAQALCLEEMLTISVTDGALWYWKTRHREPVIFDQELRQQTLDVVEQVRALFDSSTTPIAIYSSKCKACSLYDLCNPKLYSRDASKAYVNLLFSEESPL